MNSTSHTGSGHTGSGHGRAAARKSSSGGAGRARWSAKVMEHSDAMDLKAGVFKLKSARAVAQSLKRSSEASHRRKSTPFRSAMSMLNFEINRGGTTLTAERRRVLNQAKEELRKLFGRPAAKRSGNSGRKSSTKRRVARK